MSIWIYYTWAFTIPEPSPVPNESIAPRFLSQLLEDLESKDETVNSLCEHSSMATSQAFSGECELEEENEALKRQCSSESTVLKSIPKPIQIAAYRQL